MSTPIQTPIPACLYGSVHPPSETRRKTGMCFLFRFFRMVSVSTWYDKSILHSVRPRITCTVLVRLHEEKRIASVACFSQKSRSGQAAVFSVERVDPPWSSLPGKPAGTLAYRPHKCSLSASPSDVLSKFSGTVKSWVPPNYSRHSSRPQRTNVWIRQHP